jgi:hypothetical protein
MLYVSNMTLLKQVLITTAYEHPPPYSRNMTSLPTRSNTTATNTTLGASSTSSGGDVPLGDPTTSLGLLQERIQAWKHMCGYLEDYVKEQAKIQKSSSKDQEKILKSLSNPLKEGHHFDSSLGGISGLFENLRSNTQAQSALYTETEKNLTGQVLPILERLHSEIKAKGKELDSGAGKGAKAVETARKASQKHIDALAQSSARFDSSGGRVGAEEDPYVLQRGIMHRLNKQILEENNNRQDTIAVQNNFQQFEAHVLTTVQTALNSFNQFMSGQAERQKAMYGDIAATASNIPLDFEWNGFRERSSNVLLNPNAPPRSMDTVSFPNQGHRATRPLIEGSLERKARGMGALSGYKSGYYAITPAGWLHEFKDNDNYQKDPTPEKSLYLPDSVIGAVDGTKFTIKSKDLSGSKLSQKMSMTSDFQFKAHTNADAQKWHAIVSESSGGVSSSLPTSPVESRNITPIATQMEQPTPAGTAYPDQQSGVVTSPTETGHAAQGVHAAQSPITPGSEATPMSATSTTAPMSATSQHAPALTPIDEKSNLNRSPSATGQGSHFHQAPATNQLTEREYVGKQ